MRSAGDEHPQVAGDRLLEGEQLEGADPRPARARASMAASSEMTFSAISASAVSSAWVARATASCTSRVIVDELVDDRVELVEVGITHAVNGRSPR